MNVSSNNNLRHYITEESEILNLFPHDSYRKGQLACIKYIAEKFNSGKKFVIIEAPTGSGKSAIGITIAKMQEKSIYVTIQKILQEQLINSYANEGLRVLKGKANYPCTIYDLHGTELLTDKRINPQTLRSIQASTKKPNCAEGYCRTKLNQSTCNYCVKTKNADPNQPQTAIDTCEYYTAYQQAQNAKIATLNFDNLLHLIGNFNSRKLLIIDECFHPHTHIETNYGRVPIGTIVNQPDKYPNAQALSLNVKTNALEYKPIIRRLKRQKQLTYKVLAGNRVMYPTSDHKIYTPSGVKKLSELRIGDDVLISQVSITEQQKQLILGSSLSDAHTKLVTSKRISKRYLSKGTRARIRFQHGPKQFEYLDWKYNLISEHVNKPPKTLNNLPGFGKSIRRFSTNCRFSEIVNCTIVNGKKTPNRVWLDQIDDLGLAIWYMDDGSMSNNSSRFHTEGFTLEENKTIVEWLLDKWNINAKIHKYIKRGNELYYLALDRDSTRLLSKIISKYVIEPMRYKLSTQVEVQPYDFIKQPPLPYSSQQIVSIEPYKESITYDIEVADNHNYITGSTIVSNCHNIESKILDFVSLTITDHKLQEFGISIPELEDASDYAIYFEENDIRSKINLIAEVFREEENMSKFDEYKGLASKIDRFMNLLGQRWVCEYEQKQDRSLKYNSITLKPVFANTLANDILFKHFDHVLMMSATILDPTTFTSSLGIKKEDAASYKMANRFPKENRPIYIRSIAKMSGGKEQSKLWLPEMLKGKGAVDDILHQHNNIKGIIHTHNFTIAKYIMDNSKYKRRLLFQNDFQSKELMLETHANSKNSVLVAPALHEGLDLYGDLSRFQIIVKVPWPNFVDDKQLNARITDGDDGPEYLRWLTALKLIQSYGRSIRSESDWADTYILDSGISWFLKQSSMIIPAWFTDAIVSE